MSLLRKRRGVSGIISGVFLVAVAVMIFNVLAWQFFQADAYNRIFQERQQREWERYNERLLITDVELGVTTLRFNVTNYGAVTAHITDLYLTNLSDTVSPNSRHSMNFWIAPGTTRRLETGVLLELGDTYQFIMTTQRGNAFAPPQEAMINVPRPGQGQNVPFIFGFGYRDFEFSYDNSSWEPAWTKMDPGTNPYFRILVNNTYSKDVVIKGTDTRLALYPDNDFQSEAIAPTIKDWYMPAESGKRIYFDKTVAKLPTGHKQHLFVFVEIFYHFYDNPNEIYGTSVVVLAVYLK